MTVIETVAAAELANPSYVRNWNESEPKKFEFGTYVVVAVHVLTALQSGVPIAPSEPLVGPCPLTMLNVRS